MARLLCFWTAMTVVAVALIGCADDSARTATQNSDATYLNDGHVDSFGLPDMGIDGDGEDVTLNDITTDQDICYTECGCCGQFVLVAYVCGTEYVCTHCDCPPDVTEDVQDDTCLDEVCFDCSCECPDGQIHTVLDAVCTGSCGDGPHPGPVCDPTCDTVCSSDECNFARSHNIYEIEGLFGELGGSLIWVEGLLTWKDMVCTDAECTSDSPCCNDCNARVGFRTESTFYPLVARPEMSSVLGCGGNECNLFNGCYPGHPGETVRLLVRVETDAHGNPELELHDVCVSITEPTRRSDATLSWQAPGGALGVGHAVVVTGDGSIHLWEQVTEFDPATPPENPTYSMSISTNSTDELFRLWAEIDLSSIPHDDDIWMECYPRLYVTLCEDCDPVLIDYHTARQLEPEMEPIWAWFDTVLGSSESRDNPRNFCQWDGP